MTASRHRRLAQTGGHPPRHAPVSKCAPCYRSPAPRVNARFCRCDTRSHLARELADWRAGYAGRVVPGACSMPGPALSCAAGNSGVRSTGERPRALVPSGGHRLGAGRTGESREPPLMSGEACPRDGMQVRGAGTGRWEAAGAGRARHLARAGTAVPGIEEAPTPAVSPRCGTWKPRPGPAPCGGR
jgi:hypothetical protein